MTDEASAGPIVRISEINEEIKKRINLENSIEAFYDADVITFGVFIVDCNGNRIDPQDVIVDLDNGGIFFKKEIISDL